MPSAETPSIVWWLSTMIFTCVSAFIGAYLGELAKRRAIRDTLDSIERRMADISESARVRWSKRSEVCAILYGRLVMAERQVRDYLSPSAVSTDDAVAELKNKCKAFDDYFAENALFLPLHIKTETEWVAEQLLKVYSATVHTRPVQPFVAPGQRESQEEGERRSEYYKLKSKRLERFGPDGDIASKVKAIELEMRVMLDASG